MSVDVTLFEGTLPSLLECPCILLLFSTLFNFIFSPFHLLVHLWSPLVSKLCGLHFQIVQPPQPTPPPPPKKKTQNSVQIIRGFRPFKQPTRHLNHFYIFYHMIFKAKWNKFWRLMILILWTNSVTLFSLYFWLKTFHKHNISLISKIGW